MGMQVLLSMVQEKLFKVELLSLTDQYIHVVERKKGICHTIKTFSMVDIGYLVYKAVEIHSIKSWERHIGLFEYQYKNIFAWDPLFGLEFI